MGEPIRDSMEQLIAEGLNAGAFRYTREGDRNHDNQRLDFHLIDLGVHVEVKRMHTPRVAAQMATADNVIVAQGKEAVLLLARLLATARNPAPTTGRNGDE